MSYLRYSYRIKLSRVKRGIIRYVTLRRKKLTTSDTMELVALVAADRNGLTSKLKDVLVTVLRTLQLHFTAQKASVLLIS